MATHRGQDGTVTIAGVTVAQVLAWSVTPAITQLASTFMGSAWETNKGGIARWRATVRCKLDYATGQQDLLDFLAAATPTSTSAALRLQVATGKYWEGNALLVDYDLGSPSEGEFEVTFNFVGDGQLTPTWA